MQIVVMGSKGGCGKTTISVQMALNLDTLLVDIDPYGDGTLEEIYGTDRVLTLGLESSIPVIEEGDVIFDFGGFEDSRIPTACLNANLVIIPLIPTLYNMKATIRAYKIAKESGKPILFIINRVLNDSDAEQALNYLKENIKDEINYFIVPDTRALQTAENEGISIIELANSKPFLKHTYKKICAVMSELTDVIRDYEK